MEKVEVGEVFTISDEAGEENEVEVLAAFPVDGVEYVAVSFTEDLQEETDEGIDIFFLKVDEEGDLAQSVPMKSSIKFHKHLTRLWKRKKAENNIFSAFFMLFMRIFFHIHHFPFIQFFPTYFHIQFLAHLF